MFTYTFTVKRDKHGPEHEVKVSIPTWDEATPEQRKHVYDRGTTSVTSPTVYVQSVLRRALGKGVKPGAELNKVAQNAFTACLNGEGLKLMAIPPLTVIDATATKLTADQVAYFQACPNVMVVNIPEKLKA